MEVDRAALTQLIGFAEWALDQMDTYANPYRYSITKPTLEHRDWIQTSIAQQAIRQLRKDLNAETRPRDLSDH